MEKVTNNSDSNYCKMPDGKLIQWGDENNKKNGDRIAFPVSFKMVVSLSILPHYNTQTTITCVFSSSSLDISGFDVHAFDTVTNAFSTSTTLKFRWIAIGRWK